MKERFSYKKVGRNLAALAIALSACGASSSASPKETVINVGQSNPTTATVLKGNNFEIRKIGKNVFKIAGDNQENGIDYVSKNAKY